MDIDATPAQEPPEAPAPAKQPKIQKLFRETPKKVSKQITITEAEEEVWQYVRRRITHDLDTDDFISDDQVVGMSNADLCRALDKPRRLRIEFHLVEGEVDEDDPGEKPAEGEEGSPSEGYQETDEGDSSEGDE